MNPVSLLLPLDKKMKPNVEINYEETGLYYFEFVTMIKLYFDNLHRV